jgi:hypothetical protein
MKPENPVSMTASVSKTWPSGPRSKSRTTASNRELIFPVSTGRSCRGSVTEAMEIAEADSPEPDLSVRTASSQTVGGGKLITGDLIVARPHVNRDDPPLIFRAYLGEDIALVNRVATSGDFFHFEGGPIAHDR